MPMFCNKSYTNFKILNPIFRMKTNISNISQSTAIVPVNVIVII